MKESLWMAAFIFGFVGIWVGFIASMIIGLITGMDNDFNLFLRGAGLGGASGGAVIGAYITHLDNKKLPKE